MFPGLRRRDTGWRADCGSGGGFAGGSEATGGRGGDICRVLSVAGGEGSTYIYPPCEIRGGQRLAGGEAWWAVTDRWLVASGGRGQR